MQAISNRQMMFPRPARWGRVVCSLFLLMLLLPAFGQEGGQESGEGDGTVVEGFSPDSLIPEDPPYTYTFAEGLRRFEIILFGSLPVTLLLTNLVFDLSRYLYFGASEGFSSDNAQRNQIELFQTAPRTDDERGYILIGAISVSAVFAIIDLIIELVKTSDE